MALFDNYLKQSQGWQLPPSQPDVPKPKGFLSSLLSKADTANGEGLTFWDRLGSVGAGLRDDAVYQQLDAQQTAAKSTAYKANLAKQQALEKANADADALNLSGRERLVFMANPEKWAEENAKAFAPATLGAGDLRINPTGENVYNPRTFTAGDQIFNTSFGGAPEQVGEVAPTFADQTARLNATRPEYKSIGAGDSLLEIPFAGGGGGAQGAPVGGNPGADIEAFVAQLGGQISSGGRSPADNARVGGVANSMHLDNMARDFVPPAGADRRAVVAQLKSDPRFTEVLDEGDHIHVGWRPKGQAAQQQQGPRVIAQGAPKQMTRPASAAEKAAYGIPADVPAQLKPDGSIDVVSGVAARGKPVPNTVQKQYVENNATIRGIDEAMGAVDAYPAAFGPKNIFGDDIMQRMDPEGIDARSAIANIGGAVIHDRAGASQTVGEIKRLKPYIPNPTDDPKTVKKKLAGLKRQIEHAQVSFEDFYNEDNGYAPLSGGQKASNAPSGDDPLGIRKGR